MVKARHAGAECDALHAYLVDDLAREIGVEFQIGAGAGTPEIHFQATHTEVEKLFGFSDLLGYLAGIFGLGAQAECP